MYLIKLFAITFEKANLLILKQHMNHCVIEAVEHNKGPER